MNSRKMYIALGIFAVLCAVSPVLQGAEAGTFALIMGFPFQLIAMGLRALSLSGDLGNAVSIVLYVVICLIPGVTALWILRKKLKKEDWLIAVFTAMMFAAVYYMINPALLSGNYGSEFNPLLRAMLGGCCWCIVVCWLILKLIRRAAASDRMGVQKLFRICLGLIAFFFVAAAFAGAAGQFEAEWTSLKNGNTALAGKELILTAVFLGIKAIISALPYALDAVIAVKGMELLGAMDIDPYSVQTAEAGETLSRLAILSLKLTLIFSLAFNLLQMVFIRRLLVLEIELVLPLVSIAFMLAAVFLSRLIRENKSLKDDNDMFI